MKSRENLGKVLTSLFSPLVSEPSSTACMPHGRQPRPQSNHICHYYWFNFFIHSPTISLLLVCLSAHLLSSTLSAATTNGGWGGVCGGDASPTNKGFNNRQPFSHLLCPPCAAWGPDIVRGLYIKRAPTRPRRGRPDLKIDSAGHCRSAVTLSLSLKG